MNIPFLQENIKLTRHQLDLLNKWTRFMNGDSKILFVHVLMCHLQRRATRDYDEWAGAPCPRATFIHVYCRDYKWEQVERYMKRAPYNIDEGICFRYRIIESLLDQFIKAGEDFLLNFNNLKDSSLYNSEGIRLSKTVKPFSKNPATKISIQQGIEWLQREKEYQENNEWLKEEEKQEHNRRYLHNLSCFQGIIERATEINWEERTLEYSQQMRQPDVGLRLYELGGGLQGASTNFREYLLLTSQIVNVDVVKCHAVIAMHEMNEANIPNPIQQMLDDGFVDINNPMLSPKTIKVAALATINGARFVKDVKSNRSTLTKLVKEDEACKGEDNWYCQVFYNQLCAFLKPLKEAVDKWKESLPNHRIKKVSARLQQREVELLKDIKAIACNDQHDGALVRVEDIDKLKKANTGYLQVVPKEISSKERGSKANPHPQRTSMEEVLETGVNMSAERYRWKGEEKREREEKEEHKVGVKGACGAGLALKNTKGMARTNKEMAICSAFC